MILITEYAIGIVTIVLLALNGLDRSVWQYTPRTYSITGIVALFGLAALIINSWLTIQKKRRVKKGLEQWAAENESHRRLRRLFQMLLSLVLVSHIVLGIVFENQGLSFIAGGVLVFMVIVNIIDMCVTRKEKREQDEKKVGES